MSAKWILAAATLLIIAGIAILFVFRLSDEDDGDDGVLLRQVSLALAHTEQLDADAAESGWQALAAAMPGDVAAQQNLAINALIRVQQLVGRLASPGLTPEETQSVRNRLPESLSSLEAAIDELAELDPENPVAAWLRIQHQLLKGQSLPPAIGDSMRAAALDEATAQLLAHPEWSILVGPVVALAEEFADTDDASAIGKALAAASDAAPRNLFIPLEAADWLIRAQDPDAQRMVERSYRLSTPLAEEITPRAAGLNKTPQQIAEGLIEVIRAGNWEDAELEVIYWKNLFSGTAAHKTDLKQVDPNPLDLLDLAPLRQLMLRQPPPDPRDPITAADFSADHVQFEPPLGDPVDDLHWVDFDLRDELEIAALAEGRLSVYGQTGAAWTRQATAEAAADASILVVADLFVVDANSPLRIKTGYTSEDPEEQALLNVVHDTFRCFLTAGPAGIEIFRSNPNAEDPAARLIAAEETGLESITNVTALTVGDIESDGDLDLFVASSDGLQLWINRGNITFYPVAAHSQLPPADVPITDFAIADIDRDLDLDCVTIARDGTVGLLENILHQQFRWRPLQLPSLGEGRSVVVAEINGDVSWDIVAAGTEGVVTAVTETPAAGVWRIGEVGQIKLLPLRGIELADIDNDSLDDLFVFSSHGLFVLPGQPGGAFGPYTQPVIESDITRLSIADWGNDGRLDLLAVASGDVMQAHFNKPVGNYLQVRFKGIDDNATGRVNHFAIGTTLELRFGPRYRAEILTDRTAHFGLGSYEQADSLRAILPNGITQSIIEPTANQLITEKQSLKGSCPYLYSWDGEKFVFVTDCLWAAPLGLQVARGRVAADRPWEYLLVPGDAVAPRDGAYELRITEELWEAAYFDHVALSAVDHPADVDVFTNEKVGPGEIAQPKIWTLSQQQPVHRARNAQGRDVTDEISAADRRYVRGFDRRYRQGLTEPHVLELEFDVEPSDVERAALVLSGWIRPTDTSLNIAIDQHPELGPLQFPSVWVPDGKGDWKCALPYMGFPGGKQKTIVVDLAGLLPPDDPRLQIRTNAEIYWDHAALCVNPTTQPTQVQPLRLVDAQLAYHGYSPELPRQPDESHQYDYHAATQDARWLPLDGHLTRYGPVTELVRQADDRMVVMGAGDEIQLRFSLPDQPPPDGWKRDFVLHSVGWDKDADLNTLTGQSYQPLPFLEMPQYPPPAASWQASDRVWQLNADHLTRQQSFRAFWRR